MLEASTDYFISSSLESKLIGNGSNKLIFESNNIYLYDEFDKNPYSYGPHNSFIFYLINYGIVGILLYILILILTILPDWPTNEEKPEEILILFKS